MKQINELLPIAAFLIALWLKDIYVATAVLMIATALTLLLSLALKHPVTGMQWGVAAVVMVFGALTLFFHDEQFIKIKPTVVYAAMAVGFFVSERVFKKNIVQAMLSSALAPPEHLWAKLNLEWVLLFCAMAALNMVLAYNVSTTVWAWSKMGFAIITMVFVGVQVYRLRHYLKQQG